MINQKEPYESLTCMISKTFAQKPASTSPPAQWTNQPDPVQT